MDTFIQYAASLLDGFPQIIAAEGMLAFQSMLNFFILPDQARRPPPPCPLMALLADLLGISRDSAKCL